MQSDTFHDAAMTAVVRVDSGLMAPKDRQIVVRLEDALLQRVQAYQARIRAETGLSVSQADAVRKLLTEALDADDARREERRPRRR